MNNQVEKRLNEVIGIMKWFFKAFYIGALLMVGFGLIELFLTFIPNYTLLILAMILAVTGHVFGNFIKLILIIIKEK